VAQTAFEIRPLTEDNLRPMPPHPRLFGAGDGAGCSVGRWTAEDAPRHRPALTVTHNIDRCIEERRRMAKSSSKGTTGHRTRSRAGVRRLPELATRIAHRNTGRYSNDPVADKIMVRIAADENLHMVFYRDIISAALVLEPSAAVCAIVDEVLAFQMPGAGIPGFIRKAAQIAKAGIYDIRVHRRGADADPPPLADLRTDEPRRGRRGCPDPARGPPRQARRGRQAVRGSASPSNGGMSTGG
jgi:acyl-[acyl-carrier-protein] desaturase